MTFKTIITKGVLQNGTASEEADRPHLHAESRRATPRGSRPRSRSTRPGTEGRQLSSCGEVGVCRRHNGNSARHARGDAPVTPLGPRAGPARARAPRRWPGSRRPIPPSWGPCCRCRCRSGSATWCSPGRRRPAAPSRRCGTPSNSTATGSPTLRRWPPPAPCAATWRAPPSSRSPPSTRPSPRSAWLRSLPS